MFRWLRRKKINRIEAWYPAKALACIRVCKIKDCAWYFNNPYERMTKKRAFEVAWAIQQYL